MLLALLLACRCTAPEGPQEATFPTPALREVGGRFRGEPDAPLDPKVAFTLQSRCPQIERARLRLVGVSLENLQEDSPEQLVLGAREKGWREAESAIDQAKARFGRGSVRPGRLIKPGDQEDHHGD
jgi:hypothetical protein